MKLNAEYIKENYLILMIKLSLICLFVFSSTRGVLNIINHYNIHLGNSENKLTDYFHIITTNNHYVRPSLILLIPILGIYTKRKVGWILIQSYFYFLISNLIFTLAKNYPTDINFIYTYIIGFLILLLIILIMNKKRISNLTYGIEKDKLISINIIAFIIGISISMTLILTKNNWI